MEKQVRKTYKGEKNDKERTMSVLIASVGKVLEDKGYTGLTISKRQNQFLSNEEN